MQKVMVSAEGGGGVLILCRILYYVCISLVECLLCVCVFSFNNASIHRDENEMEVAKKKTTNK